MYMSDQDKKILELDTRKKLYSIIKKYAGSHFRAIQRKSGLAVGSVQHHIRFLVRRGLIIEAKEGKNLVYFPREFKSENRVLLSFLRQDSIRKILLCILMNPKCNHEEIVKFVNLSPSTVSYHIKKLQETNIITTQKQGRKTFYQLSCDKQELVNLLITYQESFVDQLVDRVIEMWSLD